MAVGKEEAGAGEMLAAPRYVIADEEHAGIVVRREIEVKHFLYLGGGEHAEAETLVVDVVATAHVDTYAVAQVAVETVDSGKDFGLWGEETEGFVSVDAAGVLEVVVEQDVAVGEVGGETVADVGTLRHAVVVLDGGGLHIGFVAHDGLELLRRVVP